MPETFADLYSGLLHAVFLDQARQQIEQGSDALTCADAYAEQGKPEFTLAFLLLAQTSDEVRRDIFARSYERRAAISDEKAASFDLQFHRPFPLIKLEAQKDRQSAQQVRQGRPIRRGSKSLNIS